MVPLDCQIMPFSAICSHSPKLYTEILVDLFCLWELFESSSSWHSVLCALTSHSDSLSGFQIIVCCLDHLQLDVILPLPQNFTRYVSVLFLLLPSLVWLHTAHQTWHHENDDATLVRLGYFRHQIRLQWKIYLGSLKRNNILYPQNFIYSPLSCVVTCLNTDLSWRLGTYPSRCHVNHKSNIFFRLKKGH